MSEMTLEITGAQEVQSGLERLERAIDDPRKPLKRTAERIADRTKARFEGGITPDIKPETRKRRRHNKTSGPLIDSGDMELETIATRTGVAHSLFALTPEGLTMGTDTPGAARHQYGYKTEPSREFLSLTDGDELGAASDYEQYLSQFLEF